MCSWKHGFVLVLACVLALVSGVAPSQALQAESGSGDARYEAASGLIREKKFAEAVAALEQFLAEHAGHPRAVQARVRLGEALLSLERYPAALAAFQAALEAKPPSDLRADTLVGIGRTHLAAGEPEKALDPLLEAVELTARDEKAGPVASLSLGDALLALERYAEAARAYARVDQWPAHPEAPRAYFMVGEAYRRAGNHAEAAATFRSVAEKYWRHPLASQASLAAAESYLALRQFDLSEAEYRRVLQQYTESAAAPRAQLGLGRIALAQGSYAVARSAFAAAALIYAQAGIASEAELRTADCFLAERNFDAAREAYQKLAEDKDPTIAREARYSLALTELRADRPEAARELFLKVADEKDARPWSQLARLRLAEVEAAAGNSDEALAALRTVLLERPSAAVRDEAHVTLGTIHLRRGDFETAGRELAEALDRSPNGPFAARASALLARCRLELKDAAGAAARASELLKGELDPELRAEVQTTLGRAQLQTKEETAGVAALKEVLEKHGSTPAAPVAARALLEYYKGAKQEPEARALEALIAERYPAPGTSLADLLKQAEAEMKVGKYAAAVEHYRKALQGQPDLRTRVAARTGLAEALAALRQPSEAAAQVDAIAKDTPPAGAVAAAHAGVGRSFERVGDVEQALAAYRAALAAGPGEEVAPAVLFRAGSILSRRKGYSEAVLLLRELVEKHARSEHAPQALYELAWCHLEQGDDAAARPILVRLAKDHPAHPLAADASFRVAEQDYRAGRFAEAAERYRAAADSRTAVADKAAYKLGWSLRQLKDHAGAAKAFGTVVAHFPESELAPECRVRAAEALLELEKDAEALGYLEPLLALQPKSAAEREILAQGRVAAALGLLMRGSFKQARELAQAAALPANGWFGARGQLILAEAIFLDQGPKAALPEYVRGATLYSRYPEVAAEFHFRTAECYEKLGDQKAAQAAWQRVVELYGETEWARRSRQKLGQAKG